MINSEKHNIWRRTASSGVEATGLTLAQNSVPCELAAVIASCALGHSVPESVYQIVEHNDRILVATWDISQLIARQRSVGSVEDLGWTDGLALDNRTYLESLLRRFHVYNASLSVPLAAVAVVVTRPATLAPVSWFYCTETALTGVDSSMSIGALAALSWHAIAVALIDANGCEVRLAAKLDARHLGRALVGAVDTWRSMAGVEATLGAELYQRARRSEKVAEQDDETGATTPDDQHARLLKGHITYMTC
jgi:hypothetical protein